MVNERRSGKDRRMSPPTVCTVPCQPIDRKLNDIWLCVKDKVEKKLFYLLMGALAFFTVVIMGGTQWMLYEKMSEVGTDVKVMKVTVDSTKFNLDRHMVTADRRHESFERRIDDLEHKTYRLENGGRNKKQPKSKEEYQ